MDCAEGTGTIHGGSVFFKGEWYMLYHNATLEGGADCRRSACIERYERNPDGSIPFIPATKKGVLKEGVNSSLGNISRRMWYNTRHDT